jgi:ADP-ribose pyrophosphatase YjhB (NUDIX family)
LNKTLKHFNIRVYGLLINERDEILLSDEFVLDTYMTKYPGGGLKFGEGPEDCILRECIEEFGQEAEIISHFYTTGFYQPALYYDDHQLISIYYRIKLKEAPRFKISTKKFDFKPGINGSQSFRWEKISKLDPESLNFPIDRFVLKLLKEV